MFRHWEGSIIRLQMKGIKINPFILYFTNHLLESNPKQMSRSKHPQTFSGQDPVPDDFCHPVMTLSHVIK